MKTVQFFQVEIPSKSEIMEQFVCNATITVKYKYKQLKPFLKCMNISQKTLIRTNEEGLLCCQFMVQVDSHTCYLEFFVSIKCFIFIILIQIITVMCVNS